MRKFGSPFKPFSLYLLGISLVTVLWTGSASAEGVRYILNWVPDGQQAAWYAGREKGFYKEQGLDLTVIAGSGSAKAVKAVGGKAAEFGLADMGEIIKGRARNIPVRAISILLAKAMNVIYVLKDSGIKKPTDLEGRTIGGPVWSSLRTVFPLFAKVNKIDASKVKWISMPPSAMAPSMYSGKVDSIATFTSNEHNIERGARAAGKKLHRFVFSEWGVNLYSLALNTLDERIKNNPSQVRRFVHASIKSLAWTAKNPKEAIKILLKSYPQATEKSEGIKWISAFNSMITETTLQHGLGYMTKAKIKFTRDAIMSGLGKDPSAVAVNDLYTNQFLPKREM